MSIPSWGRETLVPERAKPRPAARVDVVRGDVVESRHTAVVAVVDAQGRIERAWGDVGLVTYMRSAAKPFQAVPLVTTGAADAFGVTEEELALVAGSHNGEDVHAETAGRLLERAGLSEPDLRCGRHPPFHKPTAKALGDDYTAIRHNCSGKHAGMLAASVHMGWDPRTYLEPMHPVQQDILNVVGWAAGLDPAEVRIGIDGCGVPSFALPVSACARAFATLATAEEKDGGHGRALARVRRAMQAHPEMVAGDDRLDTKVIRASGGRVLVKAGAEACYGAALVETSLGVAVKVVDGSTRAVAPVLGAVLERLGVLKENVTLDDEFNPTLRNHAGRVVGRIEARLP